MHPLKSVSCSISQQKLLQWVTVDLPREYDIVDWETVTGLDPVIFFKSTVTEQIHLRVFRPYEKLQNNNITIHQS